MRLFMMLLGLFLISVSGYSATWYVPDDYGTIQEAIDASLDWDTVIVRQGTYVENIDFLGKAITVTSEQGPDFTIIDGGQPVDPDFGSVVSFMSGEGPDSVLEGFKLTNGSGNLIGVYVRGGGICCVNSSSPTIMNNIIIGNSADLQGGGVLCLNSSSPTIENNIISDNSANFGGGIYLNNSSPKIGNNLVTGNSAVQGGGILCYQSSSEIMNNTINDNSATSGGGICLLNSSPKIENNLITGNSAVENGGGINCKADCQPVCVDCIFADNVAGHVGGGFSIRESCDATLSNCLFIGNTAEDWGGGIRIGANSNAVITSCTFNANHAVDVGGAFAAGSDTLGAINQITMSNCILWGNTAPKGHEIALNGHYPAELTISYSDVAGGQADVYVEPGFTLKWGSGMIDADPLFLDPMNDDYHLSYASPCIDAGDNDAASLPSTDFEGDPRIFPGNGKGYLIGAPPQPAIVDMGADEYCLMKRQKVILK